MSDVAQLGIAVDSSQVKAGTNDLRNFEAVAKRTGETVEQVQARFAKLNQQSAGVSREAQKLAPAVQQANQQLQQIAVTSEKTNTSLNRLFGATISMIVMKATKELVSYAWNLNKTLADMVDTADRVGLSYQRIQGLGASAAYKGISGDVFNASMLELGKNVDLAKMKMGDLYGQLKLNGAAAKDTESAFFAIADQVKNASTYAEKLAILQAAGLPATREYVRFMEQGAEKIRTQADFASKLKDQQLADAKRVNDEFNKLWADFELFGKRAITNTASALTNLTSGFARTPWETVLRRKGADMLKAGTGEVLTSNEANKFYNISSMFGPKVLSNDEQAKALDIEKQKLSIQLQSLGLLGQLQTADEARLAVSKQLELAGLNNLSIDEKRAEKLKQLAYESNLGITQIKASTDALNIEAATLGMSAGQAQAYTAAQTIFNEKKRLGIELTKEQRERILQEAAALGKARDALEQMKFAQETFSSMFVSFGQNIRNGQNAWDAFANAGTNALGRIADKLIQMAADNLWKSAFGGLGGLNLMSLLGIGGGGGGGNAVGNPMVLGSLYHSGGLVGIEGQQRYIHPAYFDHAPKFHTGLMPDEFPAVLQKGEGVFTKGQMAALGGALKGGSGALSVNVGGTVVNIQGNADSKEIDRLKADLARRDAELPAKIVDTVRRAQKTRNLQ